MTKVTPAGASARAGAGYSAPITLYFNNLHRSPAKSNPKSLLFLSSRGEHAGFMSSANRPDRHPIRFCASSLQIILLIGCITAFSAALYGQGPTSSPSAPSSDSNSDWGGSSGPTPPVQAPQFVPSQVQTSAQNPVFGSVPEDRPTPGILPLTFSDAIERALRQNLAGLLSQYNTVEARGEKWQKLSDLLPNVNGDVQEVRQKVSLQALGLNSSLFPGIPAVIGPFSYFDMRASATQHFDWKSVQKYRSSVLGEGVAKYNLKDARDLVVLATGNAYLQAIAGAARVETAQSQVMTAKALYDKAVAQQQAGVAPAIDTLRAQVEYQSRQQQLIAAVNDFAKQKISLARVIGLAPRQEFELADKAPYVAFPIPELETSVQRAYSFRSDYKAAHDRLVAAQLERSAATAGYFPSFDLAANFG